MFSTPLSTRITNILTTKYNSGGTVIWEVKKDNADENDYGSAIEVDGSGNAYVAAATWVDGTGNSGQTDPTSAEQTDPTLFDLNILFFAW